MSCFDSPTRLEVVSYEESWLDAHRTSKLVAKAIKAPRRARLGPTDRSLYADIVLLDA